MKIRLKARSQLNPEILKSSISNALFKSMLKMQEIAVARAPADTGQLRRSINISPLQPGRLSYTLNDGVSYGAYVEYGTGPHTPPAEALKGWSKRVLGNDALAYAIQAKIAREGIEEQPFFRPALDEVKHIWFKRYLEQELK
jgi:hypothetical protein